MCYNPTLFINDLISLCKFEYEELSWHEKWLELSVSQFIFIWHVCPQLTDRRISLDDSKSRAAKDAALHHKTNTTANCLKHIDMLKAPQVPHRRSSVDVCQHQHLASPSPSRHMQPMPLPIPPQSGCKTISRRPALGVEGIMPSNLLNELNSVLSKTGRSAKSNDWRGEKWGGGGGGGAPKAVNLTWKTNITGLGREKNDMEADRDGPQNCRWSQSELLVARTDCFWTWINKGMPTHARGDAGNQVHGDSGGHADLSWTRRWPKHYETWLIRHSSELQHCVRLSNLRSFQKCLLHAFFSLRPFWNNCSVWSGKNCDD